MKKFLPLSLAFLFTLSMNVQSAFAGLQPGDFNQNQVLDSEDIDILSEAVRQGSTDPVFDVNFDGAVDSGDRIFWVKNIRRTYFGDANLDGVFDSSDLVFTFVSGEYEDDIPGNSTWGTGDWNGDGEFDSGDFVVAFGDGGFEQGPLK